MPNSCDFLISCTIPVGFMFLLFFKLTIEFRFKFYETVYNNNMSMDDNFKEELAISCENKHGIVIQGVQTKANLWASGGKKDQGMDLEVTAYWSAQISRISCKLCIFTEETFAVLCGSGMYKSPRYVRPNWTGSGAPQLRGISLQHTQVGGEQWKPWLRSSFWLLASRLMSNRRFLLTTLGLT